MNLRPENLPHQLKDNLAPIYLVSGDELVLVQETCTAIRECAKNKGFTERISFQVDKNFVWQDLLTAVNNLSLFSEKSLLELHMPSGKPGDKGGKLLQDYVKNPPQDKLLLIITNKLDAATQKTKWFKAVDSIGAVVQVWPIFAAKLPSWIAERMQRLGLKTSMDGLKLLAEYAEGNLLAAVQEIEKLHLLYGNGVLTPQQIMAAISDNARFSVFDLVDTVLRGELGKSIRILHSLKNEKTEPTLILWALARELRSLIVMAKAVEQGSSVEQVMQQQHVWQQRKSYVKRTLQQHSSKALQQMLQQCATLDRIIKGVAPGNIWDEFEKLCLRVSHA